MATLIKGLVTIAIPAYKRRWLAEAIESALAQDYPHVEVVIVNDHSPQRLAEVVAPYLTDSRVRYYENDRNLGRKSIVHNWNRCLDLAHGEFFVLLCDDDLLMTNFVSTLLSLAKKYPQCNVFHGRRVCRDEVNEKIKEDVAWPEYETYKEFMNGGGFDRAHTITEFMYRTEVVRIIKYVVYPLGWGSDDMSLLKFIQNGGIASSSTCIAVFRMSDEHISGTIDGAYQKARARIKEYQDLSQMPYCPFSSKQISNIIANRVIHFFSYMSWWQKMKILFYVPSSSLSLKSKLYMAVHANRYLPHKARAWEG